jgi:hypothetical protein
VGQAFLPVGDVLRRTTESGALGKTHYDGGSEEDLQIGRVRTAGVEVGGGICAVTRVSNIEYRMARQFPQAAFLF